MNKCKDCKYAAAGKTEGSLLEPASTVLKCHKHPKPLDVKEEHWCGEFVQK